MMTQGMRAARVVLAASSVRPANSSSAPRQRGAQGRHKATKVVCGAPAASRTPSTPSPAPGPTPAVSPARDAASALPAPVSQPVSSPTFSWTKQASCACARRPGACRSDAGIDARSNTPLCSLTSSFVFSPNELSPHTLHPPFSIHKWYPLFVPGDLDKAKPHAISLLGTPLAVWHDGTSWKAVADDCPHRRAPLSQGRVQAADGTSPAALVCSYHGWRFGGDGKPVAIPQATHDGPGVERATLCSPRACARAFPAREADGLLWVWADPASPGEAAAAPTPGNAAVRALPPGAVTATTNQWFMRDFHVPHDELVGNLLSQDHVPFAHSGVASSRHSPFAAHFEVTALNAARDAGGGGPPDGLTFDLEWAPDARKLVKQHVTCVPPAYIEYLTPDEAGGGLKNVL